MSKKDKSKGQYIKDQIRCALGCMICLLVYFAGLGLSMLILSAIDDNRTKSILLTIHTVLQLIFMILAVIFNFIDEKKLMKEGKCTWKNKNGSIMIVEFASGVLILAIVLEALFMFLHIAMISDFMSRT